MFLSFSIGTFLTNYDVTCKKLNTCYHTPLYENDKNEREISQWRLLIRYYYSGFAPTLTEEIIFVLKLCIRETVESALSQAKQRTLRQYVNLKSKKFRFKTINTSKNIMIIITEKII